MQVFFSIFLVFFAIYLVMKWEIFILPYFRQKKREYRYSHSSFGLFLTGHALGLLGSLTGLGTRVTRVSYGTRNSLTRVSYGTVA